jgi:hypothetical protein
MYQKIMRQAKIMRNVKVMQCNMGGQRRRFYLTFPHLTRDRTVRHEIPRNTALALQQCGVSLIVAS